MTHRQATKRLIVLVVIILFVSGLLFYLQKLIGLENIRQFIIRAGPFGPAIYILLIILTHIFAPLQGLPFYFLSFAIYGKWTVVYTHIAYLISSITNFWIARKFGRDIIVKLVGHEGMQKIDHISIHEGPKALFIIRLFQGWINDFVSYAAGLTPLKFSTYYIISFLAPLPLTILTFLFFNQIPQNQVFFLSMTIGLLFFIVPPIYYFLKHKFSGNKISHVNRLKR
ncbi:MAG: VTT domain-containing protein [bacterium]|nr:VTT domain-containing protein [bacterium]